MDSSMKLHLSSRLSIVEQLDEHYQVVRCKMHNKGDKTSAHSV